MQNFLNNTLFQAKNNTKQVAAPLNRRMFSISSINMSRTVSQINTSNNQELVIRELSNLENRFGQMRPFFRLRTPQQTANMYVDTATGESLNVAATPAYARLNQNSYELTTRPNSGNYWIVNGQRTNIPPRSVEPNWERIMYYNNNNDNNPTNNTPLDQFNIKNILGLDILDSINISLTNMGLFVILSTIFIIYTYVINNNFNKIVPNNTSASSESIYATVHGIVISQINDKKGQQYFPLIFVLFIFILTNNLIGMVPYTFATTSHFILTFSLSFTLVLGATYLGFYLHKTKFFSLFVPSGCPIALLYLLVLIEFISYLSRPVSLGLRLAANVLSGHMLLNILSGFTYNIMNSGIIQLFLGLLPLAFVIAFSGLEVGVAFIQAQVFVVLSCSYIKDGLDLH